MHKLIPAVFSWSGGKDSMLALHRIVKEKKYDIRYLLTTVSAEFGRVAMHGVREELLEKQARSLNISLVKLKMPEMPTMETYEVLMNDALLRFKAEGIDNIVFGDIFLEDLKRYREAQVASVGMLAVFPLWGAQSEALVAEFIDLGYKTIIACTQDGLQDFCGQVIDSSFVASLPSTIDCCGENGEFHTFVFDGPLFRHRVKFELGESVFKTFPSVDDSNIPVGYWYVDLI